MPKIEVREILGQEMMDIMHWLPGYGLNPTPPMPDKEERQEIFKKRKGATYYALFEDNNPVACAASSEMSQNIRSSIFPMAGVWGVATHPAARRKGYQREVLEALMSDMKDKGKVVSCLYPFRGSFYERLGYVTFPVPRKAIFESNNLISIAKQEFDIDIDLMLIGDGFDLYRDYIKVMQKRTHGMAIFKYGDRGQAQRNNQWLAVAKSKEGVEGVMLYNLSGDYPTVYKMRVTRFYYQTSRAKYSMLTWIARHIDQAKSVELFLPTYEHPETWLSDLRIELEPIFFPPMGRIIKLSDFSGMQVGEGQFTAEIIDPHCPWNEGIWKFSTESGLLNIEEGSVADCQLTIQGLSALMYGTHSPEDFEYLGWGVPTSGLIEEMAHMFSVEIPYMHEMF